MDKASGTAADDVHPIVDERIGHFLSCTPPVVERILFHLNAKDLNSSACVCKLWSKIAEGVKKKRRDILWMFQATFYPGLDASMLGGGDDEHCTGDMVYMCEKDNPWGLGDHFYESLEYSRIQPKTGIMFCSTHILSKPQKYFTGYEKPDKKKSTKHDFYYHKPFMQYLRTELPKDCRMICCGTPGIIGTPVDNSIPSEVKFLTGFSACMLPNLPGLQMQPFSVAEEERYTSRKRKKFDDAEISRFTGIPENQTVKALLLFCEDVPDRGGVTRAIVEHYLKTQDLKIALGGAIVESVIAPMQSKDEWPLVAGIAFTGDNLNAASIVIKSSIKSVSELEEKFMQLKNSIRMGSQSIAFMFVCCGKNCRHNKESNVEPKTFRKVFPDTLLLGCFCNGEIGVTYLPDASSQKTLSEQKKFVKTPDWLHGYTSIFVLLSW